MASCFLAIITGFVTIFNSMLSYSFSTYYTAYRGRGRGLHGMVASCDDLWCGKGDSVYGSNACQCLPRACTTAEASPHSEVIVTVTAITLYYWVHHCSSPWNAHLQRSGWITQ